MGLKLNPLTGMLDIVGSGGGGGPAVATRYTTTFNNSTDWTLSAPDYVLTVLATTHGKGAAPNVQVFEDVSGSYENVTTNILINGSGDVAIRVSSSPDNRFNGLILII